MTLTTSAHVWPAQVRGEFTGPWEQAFWCTVLGHVSSKSNYRFDAPGRAQWAVHKAFASTLELAARSARPRGWVTGTPDQPVARRPKIVAVIFCRSMLDVGNLDKSIFDAVAGTPRKGKAPATSGVVMASDAQVAGTAQWAVRTSEHTGVLVAFARLAPGAEPGRVTSAMAALTVGVDDILRAAGTYTP